MKKSPLGESWIGLDKLHQLTSERSYSLKITMTDYDKKTFVAVYNNFKVSHTVLIYIKLKIGKSQCVKMFILL